VEDALKERAVARAAQPLLEVIDLQSRPGVDGWIHVAEVPFIGRKLAVGVHVPFASEQDELTLHKGGVYQGHRDAMERVFPGGEPWILPVVGHRQDLGGVEVAPVAVAAVQSARWRRRLGWVAVEPPRDVVVVELLVPGSSEDIVELARGCDILIHMNHYFSGTEPSAAYRAACGNHRDNALVAKRAGVKTLVEA
jgi:hypothetical protein